MLYSRYENQKNVSELFTIFIYIDNQDGLQELYRNH